MDDFARFPARVLFSDGRLIKKGAVVVANGRARIAEQTPSKVVNQLLDAEVESVERLADRTTLLTFPDGLTARIGKGEGCSCGSPLKTWYSQALRGAA